MLAHLDDLGIPLEVRTTSVRWIFETNLMHLQVAVDDMGPKRLAGYGALDPTDQAAVARIQDDLTRLLERVRAYLRQGLGRDLPARLAHLDASGATVKTLDAAAGTSPRLPPPRSRPRPPGSARPSGRIRGNREDTRRGCWDESAPTSAKVSAATSRLGSPIWTHPGQP